MAGRPHDGVSPTPFLEWFDRRAAALHAEHAPDGQAIRGNGQALALWEIGWDEEAGGRRIYRWRHENVSGVVERAEVEDALDHAEVPWNDVYGGEDNPTCDTPRGFGPAFYSPVWDAPAGCRMTDDQVAAAHLVYMRSTMSLHELAGLLWERYGYTEQDGCRRSLLRGFRRLALPERRCCAGTRSNGEPCRRWADNASRYCCVHDPAKPSPLTSNREKANARRIARGRRHFTPELLRQARTMHLEWGMSMNAIARDLLPQTELTSHVFFAKTLCREFKAHGWFYPDRQVSGRGHTTPDRKDAAA